MTGIGTRIRTWWRTVIGMERDKVADRGTGKGTRWREDKVKVKDRDR